MLICYLTKADANRVTLVDSRDDVAGRTSWFIAMQDGHPLISHSGGDDGFMTDLILAPDAHMGLVLMTNALPGGPTLPQAVIREFLRGGERVLRRAHWQLYATAFRAMTSR